MLPRTLDQLAPGFITLEQFQLGICSETWDPETTEHEVVDNQVHTFYNYPQDEIISNGSTSFTIQLKVSYLDSKPRSVYGHELKFVVRTIQGTDVELIAPVLYTIFDPTNKQLIPNGSIQLFSLDFKNKIANHNDLSTGNSEIDQGTHSRDPNNQDPSLPLHWSGSFNTLTNYTALGSAPTHFNLTVFGHYALKIPADVDTIEINGYQCRWKRVNMYTLTVQLNTQLMNDFEYPNLFTIRFPQTWFVDQSESVFNCPVDGSTKLQIRPHFVVSLFNKDSIHFMRDFTRPNFDDDDPTKSYVVDSGTHPLPSFSTSFSFYEASTNFFFTVTAFDFAGAQDHFDGTTMTMNLNLKTSFKSDIDQKRYSKQRFDLLLSHPRNAISSSPQPSTSSSSDEDECYVTFVTPTSKMRELQWTLPKDLYPEATDQNNAQSSLNATLSTPLPRMFYHTIYGFIQDKGEIVPGTGPAHTTMEITTQTTKTTPPRIGSQWTSSPVSSSESIPASSVVLDTTNVDIKAISPQRNRYQLSDLKVLFTQLNHKGNVFLSSPKQLIISLPQPNLVFVDTDLGPGSELGPLCTWQYVALLNSEVVALRGTFSWFAAAPASQRHFEWPPTEWVPAKRIIFNFVDDLDFNPFTTFGGDAILHCPTVSIVSLAMNQFVSSGSNFPYKNLGKWNQTNVVPSDKVNGARVSNSIKANNNNNNLFSTDTTTTPNNLHQKSTSRLHSQNTIPTPLGPIDLGSDWMAIKDLLSFVNESTMVMIQSIIAFSNRFLIASSNQLDVDTTFQDAKVHSDWDGPNKIPDADLLLTTQFVMNDRFNVYAMYQQTIIANFYDKVEVKSISLDLFKVIKTIIIIAIPLAIVLMIAFALYQAIYVCCKLRKQGEELLDEEEVEANHTALEQSYSHREPLLSN